MSEELNEKYERVKEAIRGGMKVSRALKEHKLDHGSYYGRREKDQDPVKKSGGWSRRPTLKIAKKQKPSVLTVPLEHAGPKSEEKIVAIVCQPSQLKTILEGLNE